MKPPRYKYPTGPLKGCRYVHVCQKCGAERVSTVNPGSCRAPKICATCYHAEQNRRMVGWVSGKPLPKRAS